MNKISQLKTAVLAIGVLGFSAITNAQSTTEKDSLSSETVIIIREFEPVIKDAKKINHQPVINLVEKKSPEFSYDLLDQDQEVEFTPDTIKAVKIKGEPLNKLYRAYAKAGIGSHLNTLGEFHINSLRSRDLHWGLDVNHLGSNGGINDRPESAFSKQNINLYGKKLLKQHAITAAFNFDREQVNKYGFNTEVNDANPAIPGSTNDLSQTYMVYGGNAGLKSFITDSAALNYDVKMAYYNMAVNPSSTSENNFVMTSKFSKFFGTEKGYFYLDVDYNKLKTDSVITDFEYKGNLLIKPSVDIEFKGEKWHLLAGFKIGFEKENDAKFYFFPNAEFKFNVVRNLIVPYIGVTGNVKRNSFNSLRMENPFLTELPEIKTTKTAYDAYVGVRGLISSNLSYNVAAGYKKVNDMVLYDSHNPDISIINYENVYQPIYDTVNVAHVSSQVGYQREDKWNVMWRMKYNFYETLREAKAWNLPGFTTDLSVRYSLQDKIIAKSSITFMSGKYVRTNNSNQEEVANGIYGRKIDPIFDFNLGMEYRFTKKLSAFVDVNNILSKNYEIWGNYQVQGINVMAGITYSFWKK